MLSFPWGDWKVKSLACPMAAAWIFLKGGLAKEKLILNWQFISLKVKRSPGKAICFKAAKVKENFTLNYKTGNNHNNYSLTKAEIFWKSKWNRALESILWFTFHWNVLYEAHTLYDKLLIQYFLHKNKGFPFYIL